MGYQGVASLVSDRNVRRPPDCVCVCVYICMCVCVCVCVQSSYDVERPVLVQHVLASRGVSKGQFLDDDLLEDEGTGGLRRAGAARKMGAKQRDTCMLRIYIGESEEDGGKAKEKRRNKHGVDRPWNDSHRTCARVWDQAVGAALKNQLDRCLKQLEAVLGRSIGDGALWTGPYGWTGDLSLIGGTLTHHTRSGAW